MLAALARRGVRPASAKVGPDYIDPAYHALATGRPARNLDGALSGAGALPALAAQAAAGADVLVVEGAMGLFDGIAQPRDPRLPEGSTAEVAAALGAPVVLVVDASGLSGSVAALVHGFTSFSPAIGVRAVICNRVGSASHARMLESALTGSGASLLGCIPRDPQLSWPSRHLGLVPPQEQGEELERSLARLTAAVERHVDLEGLLRIASEAPRRTACPLPSARPSGRARVALAAGPAFGFVYPENLERLQEAGADLVPFDPRDAPRLPECTSALYAAGGFPESFAAELSSNRPLLADLRGAVSRGLVVWAECGGLLWLARHLDGSEMAGVVPAEARMTGRRTLGYRRADVLRSSPVAAVGTTLSGHEFHYSTCEPGGDALLMHGRDGARSGGFASGRLFASYLHLHLGADPSPAERFVAAASAASSAGASAGNGQPG